MYICSSVLRPRLSGPPLSSFADRNPHFPGLKKVLAQFLDRYAAQEKPKSIYVLDLAAGSGEATEVRVTRASFRPLEADAHHGAGHTRLESVAMAEGGQCNDSACNSA